MIHASAVQSWRQIILAAICVVLAACSTTQKSSTGSGEQAAAPISDAANPGAATGQSSDSTGAAAAAASSKQRASESAASSGDSDDAALLKRQLADQDAQINKLRADQLAGVGQADPVAGREALDAADQQSAAGAKDQAASKVQDELAVFPRDGNSADDDSGQPAVAPAVERSVYFGYDQYSVADKYNAMLLAHAAYLKAHPNVLAEVRGNCDDRGSREYNLALGARRAESVKRALELAGADGSRISAISYGAEKPVAAGKDEESYRQNRRADIDY